jgi:predicted P-loop ATPase
MSDAIEIDLTEYLQRVHDFEKVSKSVVSDAITLIANNNHRDSARDWLKSLPAWDEKKRIDEFFSVALGAPENLYTSSASANFFISIVARIIHPGCQSDHMVILEGPQGVGKTSALRIIGGPWYAPIMESPTSKDFALALSGILVAEISELEGFNKADVAAIKSKVSTPVDRFRPPYGKRAQDFPRRTTLVGTTNESNYLRDDTGARRFWPIEVGKIDLTYIKENRDQLFSEALYRLQELKETWWEMPAEATVEAQESRREVDPWEEPIREFLDARLQLWTERRIGFTVNPADPDNVAVSEILEFLEIDKSRRGKWDQMRVTKILIKNGYEKVTIGPNRLKRWRRSQ